MQEPPRASHPGRPDLDLPDDPDTPPARPALPALPSPSIASPRAATTGTMVAMALSFMVLVTWLAGSAAIAGLAVGDGRWSVAAAPIVWGFIMAVLVRQARLGIILAMVLHGLGTTLAIFAIAPWTGLSDMAANRPGPLHLLAPGALLLPVIAGGLAGFWEQHR